VKKNGAAYGQLKSGPKVLTVFRVYAHLMVMYACSLGCTMLGLGGILLGAHGLALIEPSIEIAFGVISIIYGPLLYYWESSTEGKPISDTFPLRAVIWLLSGGALCTSFALITVGVALICAAIIDMIGFHQGEEWIEPRKPRKKPGPEPSLIMKWAAYWEKEYNKGKKFWFCVIYFIGNLAAFIVTAITWWKAVDELPEDKKLSYWAPFAKAFGAVIDINSSLILLPVCRTMLRMMYNVATLGETCFSYVLRELFEWVPLDHNHMLHKALAKITLFGVLGHTLMHFINYSIAPEPSLARFGIWPFISGMILLIIMMFIYCGGFDAVKRKTFEIFWYSHHLFIPYFILILVHGKGGLNPNFWKYFLLPGILYIIERILRVVRSKNEVRLMSVLYMEPKLLSLEFDKKSAFPSGFKEGQYLFINCPVIKKYEWHPFTISSPPQRDTFTLHIQTQGPKSWTLSVKNYLLTYLTGKKGGKIFRLKSRGPDGVMRPGRVLGPSGENLFLIDGPHSAPTQHMTEYTHCMVCGAGIGLTPVAACVESVVYHRWKFSTGIAYPTHAHFAWVVSYRDIKAYRWFISRLKEVQDAVVNMRVKNAAAMSSKTFRFYIYVTSAPKDVTEEKAFAGLEAELKGDPMFWGLPAPEAKLDKVDTAKANFSKMDLYKAVLCPAKERTLGDITIYSGRPKWDDRFNDLARMHPNESIGVMFCGNKFIAHDLKAACAKHTTGRMRFTLHKENF